MAEEEKKELAPIIIIKKKGHHAGHHGGAWKVAYADFVTAMMAFFLVMWLVNQSPAVKQGIGGYFRDPVGFNKKAGQGMFEGGASPVKSFKYEKKEPSKDFEGEKQKLADAGEKIRDMINKSPDIEKLKDFVEIEMVPEGLRIQLIDASATSDSSIFFALGSAKLKPRTSLLLSSIASELGNLPNHIIVEGHTDSRPFTGRIDYSNWELSSDRANSARRLMEFSGLHLGQIFEVRGNADTQLRFASTPDDPRNRRVAIIVLSEEYENQIRNIGLTETAQK
ncbi:MAG: OmpA family protein [candidate division Zixibacteria bacterium]|nr:OmpA family protein [candidate division Zixibacteria bacterium]